jgi:hypothetical protein
MKDGIVLHNLNTGALRDALQQLGSPGNSFAILNQDEMNYLQTSGNDADGYILEYQLESLGEHCQSTDAEISKEAVIQDFLSYLEGSSRWWENHSWNKIGLGSGGRLQSIKLMPFWVGKLFN